MSIADKLATIEANVPKVYDAGYQKGLSEGGTDFMEIYQDGGNRRDYNSAFAGAGWNDETFKPKYPIIVGSTNTYGMNIFAYSHISSLKNVDITINNNYTPSLFAFCPNLIDVFPLDLTGTNDSTMSSMYRNSPLIETIEIYNIHNGVQFSQTFTACFGLKNLILTGTIGKTFSLAQSSLLTNESVQNIIDCLADLTGSTSITFYLHSDVIAQLTDEQKATILAKNWVVG